MTFRACCCGAFALVLGCSSSDKVVDAVDAQGSLDADLDAAAPVDAADETASEAAVDPKAPTLTDLMKMNGALHVNWKNNQTCDAVVGERKSDTEPYAQIFSVPGTVNNKMDGLATANTVYTYRLRCKVGASFSAYSNELSKNPTL